MPPLNKKILALSLSMLFVGAANAADLNLTGNTTHTFNISDGTFADQINPADLSAIKGTGSLPTNGGLVSFSGSGSFTFSKDVPVKKLTVGASQNITFNQSLISQLDQSGHESGNGLNFSGAGTVTVKGPMMSAIYFNGNNGVVNIEGPFMGTDPGDDDIFGISGGGAGGKGTINFTGTTQVGGDYLFGSRTITNLITPAMNTPGVIGHGTPLAAVNFTGTSVITLGNHLTINANTVTFSGGTLKTLMSGSNGSISNTTTLEINGSLVMSGNEKVVVESNTGNLTVGQKVKLIDVSSGHGAKTLSDANVTANNSLVFKAQSGDQAGDTLNATPGATGEDLWLVLVGATPSNDAASKLGFDDMNQEAMSSSSSAAGAQFVRGANNQLSPENRDRTIESAAQIAVISATPAITGNAATNAINVFSGRISLSAPSNAQIVAFSRDINGKYQAERGMSAGENRSGVGLWAMPMYQKVKADGFSSSGNFKTGYNSQSTGIALGADVAMDQFVLGGSANLSRGDVSSTGDLNKTKSDFDVWSVNLYGAWRKERLGLSVGLVYVKGDNDIKQNSPVANFAQLTAKAKSSAFAFDMRSEYIIPTSSVDIIPYAGLRYSEISVDDYNLNGGGNNIFRAKTDTQRIWSVPVGLSLVKTIKNDSGWNVMPRADIGALFNSGDLKARSTVHATGLNNTGVAETETHNRNNFNLNLGFDANKGRLTFGVHYALEKSSNLTSQSLYGNLRMDF